MQLKPNEPERVVDGGNDFVQDLSNGEHSASDAGNVSNNGYFNPEMDFDPAGDGIFETPKIFDQATDTTYNNNDINYGNTYGAGPNSPQADPTYNPESHPRKLTKKEFFDSPRNRKDRDRIIISAIVVIITAIFDYIRTDFWLSALKKQIEFVNDMADQLGMSDYTIDVDRIMKTQIFISVLLIALGLGILILKSRACAIAGLVLTIINFVSTLINAHQVKWYWAMIAFGFAVASTFSFAANWKEYEENGDWKREW